MTVRGRFKGAAAVALLLLYPGCVEPLPPDPGLPPWVVSKEIFSPAHEWWTQRTIISTPFTNVATFVGDGDLADRITWRVEEKYLIAERSFPLFYGDGDDVDGLNDSISQVAIYPIERHFDVIDGQIVESPNKQWYDRGHIKVDWGTDLSGQYRFALGRMERVGPSFHITDPSDPDAPIVTASYIDFTTHATVAPSEQVNPEDASHESWCSTSWQLLVDIYDCSPMDVVFRTSMLRIPDDHDYEPIDVRELPTGAAWDDGFWRTGRMRVTEEYGLHLDGLETLNTRYRIWERSRDDDGAPLAYRDRTVRVIPFYVNEGFADELFEAASWAVEQWDGVLRSVVKEQRRWECVDADGDEQGCADEVEVPDDVIVLCHNPVQDGDAKACGKVGLVARLGDIRYSFLAWLDTPSVYGLTGLAWWTPDILTSEIIAGHAKVYGPDIDVAAAVARDAVLMSVGALAPAEVAEGGYTSSFAADARSYGQNPFAALVGVELPDGPLPPGPGGADSPPPPTSEPVLRARSSGLSRSTLLAPALGTPFEEMALDEAALLAGGVSPSDVQAVPNLLDVASPLRWPFHQRRDEEVAARLSARGAELSLPVDVDIQPLIEEYEATMPGFGEDPLAFADAIYQDLRERFARVVLAHELGHVLGMRHNFSASSDGLNYRKEFWDRKDRACIGPRYQCPLTAGEQQSGLLGYGYASIMDYHQAVTGYEHGLGRFDAAAVHMLYGGMAEVFDYVPDDEGLRLLERLHKKSLVVDMAILSEPDAGEPSGARYYGYHPYRFPDVIGDLDARTFVPATRLGDPHNWQRPSGVEDGRPLVPYRRCGDEQANLLPACFRYDRGLDTYEIITGQINWARAYYPINNFRRGRLDFSVSNYVGGMYARVYYPIKLMNDYLMHYHWEHDAIAPGVFADPDVFGPVTMGVRQGFNFLGQMLFTPEPGPMVRRVRPDGVELLVPHQRLFSHPSPQPPAGDIEADLPLGAARLYRSTEWLVRPGGPHVDNVGSAVDKELALEALLDPAFFYFGGMETWHDSEIWMVNFYRTHPRAMMDLIGSIVADDVERVAPYYDDATGKIAFRDYADLTSTVPGTPVEPALTFNLRIRTLIYGLGLMYTAFSDRTFLDATRVFVVGSSDEVALDPAQVTRLPVDFTDPFTGKLYRAYTLPDAATGVELGIGARLIAKAQATLASYESPPGATPEEVAENLELAADALRDHIDILEIVRSLVLRFEEAGYRGFEDDPRDTP